MICEKIDVMTGLLDPHFCPCMGERRKVVSPVCLLSFLFASSSSLCPSLPPTLPDPPSPPPQKLRTPDGQLELLLLLDGGLSALPVALQPPPVLNCLLTWNHPTN